MPSLTDDRFSARLRIAMAMRAISATNPAASHSQIDPSLCSGTSVAIGSDIGGGAGVSSAPPPGVIASGAIGSGAGRGDSGSGATTAASGGVVWVGRVSGDAVRGRAGVFAAGARSRGRATGGGATCGMGTGVTTAGAGAGAGVCSGWRGGGDSASTGPCTLLGGASAGAPGRRSNPPDGVCDCAALTPGKAIVSKAAATAARFAPCA